MVQWVYCIICPVQIMRHPFCLKIITQEDNDENFDYSLVKDSQYFKDGRMDAHSDHTYYRDGEEAQEKATSFRYDLNGIWKFHYARNYGSAISGFEKRRILLQRLGRYPRTGTYPDGRI